jgi:hypothetical protein
MREIDPFAYFLDHASAIEGFGGQQAPPDPRYCFHSNYKDVRPGPAKFGLRLHGAAATRGELTVWVHAYKPGTMSDVSLVAGNRLPFDNRQGGDIEVSARFQAVRGVHYAFYGFFSEPSDLRVSSMTVVLDELPETDVPEAVPDDIPRSPLAPAPAAADSSDQARSSRSLVYAGRPLLGRPVSQDCTLDQLRELGLDSDRRRPAHADAAWLRRWELAVSTSVLDRFCTAPAGLKGLVVEDPDGAFAPQLAARGFAAAGEPFSPTSLLAPDEAAPRDYRDVIVSFADLGGIGERAARLQALRTLAERLMIGGFGIFCLRYRPEADPPGSSAIARSEALSRNEIGQWALHLIGSEFSVAQLAFAPVEQLALDEEGKTRFVFIIQRC